MRDWKEWNACYERNEAYWDRGAAAPALEVLLEKHPALFRGHVLVPGCGLGHDARWLAARGCDVVGADIAPLAIERARALDPERRVDFRTADLFDLPSELRGAFDVVWEHTCLCALDPGLRQRYVAGIWSALKPGGIVAGVFFINPNLDPGEIGPPFGIEVQDLVLLWEGGGFRVEEHWVPDVAHEGREGRERVMLLRLENATAAKSAGHQPS